MTLMPWHRRPALAAPPGLQLSPCQAAIFLLGLAAYDGLVRRWTTTCQPAPCRHPGGLVRSLPPTRRLILPVT